MADYRYPSNLGNINLHPGLIQFQFFNRDNTQRLAPTDSIQLYMPEQASAPSSISYDSENFGLVGNFAAKALKSGQSATDMEATINGALERVKNQVIFGTVAGGVNKINSATNSSANMSVNGLMGQVAGKVPNPYLTCVFRGVDFRNFNFTFKFTPLSERDCYTIDKIIRTMRKHAYPNYMDDSAFLQLPSECSIAYFWKGKVNPFMHKFKLAVCTGIDVDYTSAGTFATLRNGMPAHITLSTQWKEVNIITRQDIEYLGY